MQYLGLTLLFLVSLLLQSTLFNFFEIGGVKPDLVLLLVIFYAFTNGPRKGAVFGLCIGLVEDMFFGHYIGMNALALLGAGCIAGWFGTIMYKDNLIIAVLVTFCTSVISQSMILFSGLVVGLGWTLELGWRTVISLAAYNTCLVPFTYRWFYRSVTCGFFRYRRNFRNHNLWK